ncbi:MFS polyamine transporter [Gymnopilus junonius]|uniref:MFS polyamine transporter n=1 Tax=Gymnopilus junonius TaxID=109634 RepID=A0A9P5NKU6_GYMJU|nr:MFS polyamine transporter [Gymnopilus junonius]
MSVPTSSPLSRSRSRPRSLHSEDTLPENLEDVSPEERIKALKEREEEERAEREQSSSSSSEETEIVVDWDGPNDRTNPKNWSYKKKWAATLVVSSFTFISPVSSSMVAPATEQIAQQFGVTSSVLIAMMTSVFFIGPLSEIYGRSRVLQISNLFYLAWNIGCGFAQNRSQLIAFRLLAGLGGSAPLSVGGGVLGDTWHPEERGRAIAIYSLAPLLGPVIGPVCGGWIAERSTWRWVFWSTSIVDVMVQISGLFFLKETYAPYLLEKKAVQIRKDLAEKGSQVNVKTVFDGTDRTWQHIFRKAMTRPFALFAREPIIQLLGAYMAFVYGIFYLFLTTMPSIFTNVYHNDAGIGGLHYIALGVGLSLSSQVNARFMDKIYIHFKNKNGGVGEPEFRLPSMVPGTILLPFGLLLSGWSAQHHLHWIATDIGIACIGAGLILVFQSMQTYVVDAFTLHAASALAAVSCLRSLAGFGFPLFANAMYNKLGYGKGDTILACLCIGLGCPAPILLWKYGRRIRMSSRYARKSPHPHPQNVNANANSNESRDPAPASPTGVEGEKEKETV